MVRVDPLGEVPEPLAALPPGDRDLAAPDHEIKEPGDVLVVGPAGRLPRLVAGVGELSGRQRPFRAQPVEDVQAAAVIGRHPLAPEDPPLARFTVAGPLGHLAAVQRQVLGRAQEGQQLDQVAVRHRALEVLGLIGRPEPGPRDQVGARCHGADRVELEHRELADHREQIGRPLSGEKLCPNGDPPRVRPGETVHLRHERSLTHAAVGPRSEHRLPTAAAPETSVPRPVAAIVGVDELERGELRPAQLDGDVQVRRRLGDADDLDQRAVRSAAPALPAGAGPRARSARRRRSARRPPAAGAGRSRRSPACRGRSARPCTR